MSNANDFIGRVYDTLAHNLGVEGTSANVLMQMAWPGYTLSPTDFKPADAPNGPYDSGIAEETLSALADLAPTFNKVRFDNSGFEISDLYELLILSAIPSGVKPEDVAVNPIHKLFSDAQFDLLNARRGSRHDPNQFYYPCTATPNNWYDEAAAAYWPKLEIKSADTAPAPPGSTFTQKGGAEITKAGLWKLKPNRMLESEVISKVQTDIATRNNLAAKRAGAPAAAGKLSAHPLQSNVIVAAKRSNLGMAAVAAGAMRTSEFAANLSDVRASTMYTTRYSPTTILAKTAPLTATLQPDALDKAKFQIVTPANLPLASQLIIKESVNQLLVPKPVSPASTGFSISFKYCRVNLARPWLKLALLNTKNWFMSGTPVNYYSTGSADTNPGLFPLLPSSFIAIRDLQITANWSQEDKNNAANSAAFGPFDIRNGTLNQNTIEVKGLQVICWISNVTPAMPPSAA